MKLISKVILPLMFCESALANTIYGINHIANYKHSFGKPTAQVAHTIKKYPKISYGQLPIAIQKLPQQVSTLPQRHYERINDTINAANWFIGAQFGAQKIGTSSSTTVGNSSGFQTPYNRDIYTANNSGSKGLLGLQAGRRWELPYHGLSAFSLGASYQHFFKTNINGQVIQYSLPQFTNYDYSFKTDSNLLFANAKINLIKVQNFSPYINAGIGAVFNKGKYSESVLPNVTSRISPSFQSNVNTQFSYVVGAGLEYQLKSELMFSAAYQYSDLGNLRSGAGTGTWSADHLSYSHYHSNALLLGLTYLFDFNGNKAYQK